MNIPAMLKGAARRFVENKKGSLSTVWAVSSAMVVISAGSAYDVNQLAKAKKVAQIAADNMALAASISVDHENPDKYTEGQSYPYTELGGPLRDFTDSMTGSVEYDIVDDLDPTNASKPEGDRSRLIARATVTGTYDTAFMAIAGMNTVSFKAISDVSYAAEKGSPASVFFIVDNSGSMGDLDTSGTKKITSLETSMGNFMTTLSVLDRPGSSVFRTAMYPYSADPNGYYSSIENDGVIPSHVVAPEWGVIQTTDITRMYDRYGTDSSGALSDAASAFSTEEAVHLAVNQEQDPLKFAVFMTDGANNPSCENQQYGRVDGPFWYRFNNGVLETADEQISGNWNYFAGTKTNNSYTYCKSDYWFDQRSLVTCSDMKADGIKIFAIAYDIDDAQKVRAEQFMQDCSSGAEYFQSASDAVALDLAFNQISDSIISEVIRIKR